MWRNDLAYLFPLPSQTSPQDRLWLAKLFEYVRGRHEKYRHVEVGSYLGGTLTPALLDERCVHVLSIDLRPKIQPDCAAHPTITGRSARRRCWSGCGAGTLDLGKLKTFDGGAGGCDFQNQKYQMAFIDAEHTDEAVFSDFLAVYDHLAGGAVCGFHDTNQVTAGMENICRFLGYQRREHGFVVLRDSCVSAIFLDQARERMPGDFAANACDWGEFKNRSRDELLLETVRNRCTFSYTLREKPVIAFSASG